MLVLFVDESHEGIDHSAALPRGEPGGLGDGLVPVAGQHRVVPVQPPLDFLGVAVVEDERHPLGRSATPVYTTAE